MSTKTIRAAIFIIALLMPAAAQSQSDQTQNYGPATTWKGWPWNEPADNGYVMGPGMMGYSMMHGCPAMRAITKGGNFRDSAAAWLDGQLAYAHSELGVTTTQEAAWKNYVATVHDLSSQMLAAHQSMVVAMWQTDLPFDQAYDLHIQVTQAHLDTMKAARDTAMRFYNVLSPAQQERASWILPQSMCMM